MESTTQSRSLCRTRAAATVLDGRWAANPVKRSRLARISLWFLASFVTLSLAARAQTTISDSTFADANWTLTQFPGGNGGGVFATQLMIAGDPYRVVVNTVSVPPARILGTHIYNAFTYDPSVSGAIGTIDYFEDAACISFCFGQGQWTGPAVLQGGKLYVGPIGPLTTGAQTTFLAQSLGGLTAASLSLVNLSSGTFVDDTQHPDFSGAGAPIQFGFFRANASNPLAPSPAGNYSLGAGIDNWRVVIHAAVEPAAAVPTLNPLPMAGLALFLALAGVLFLRRTA